MPLKTDNTLYVADMSIPRLPEWLADVLPLLLSKKVQRMDGETMLGPTVIYWVGNVLRIDIKRDQSEHKETPWTPN